MGESTTASTPASTPAARTLVGGCTRAFSTRAAADEFAWYAMARDSHAERHARLVAYSCDRCGGFHVRARADLLPPL